jgi:hypothetical protein
MLSMPEQHLQPAQHVPAAHLSSIWDRTLTESVLFFDGHWL